MFCELLASHVLQQIGFLYFWETERLTELLGQKVELAPDCIGPDVEAKIGALKVELCPDPCELNCKCCLLLSLL
jgi:hypothetical protein